VVPETIGIPRVDQLAIDRRVCALTLGAALLATIIFGFAPALQSLRTDVQESLKESARASTSGVRGRRFGGLLVVSQVALTFVLLVGVGLLVRSFLELQRVAPGITAQNVLTLRIPSPDRPAHVDPADLRRRDAFQNEPL